MKLTFRDYRRGLHNFKEAQPPKLIHCGKEGWMVLLTWSNVIRPVTDLNSKVVEQFRALQQASETHSEITEDASQVFWSNMYTYFKKNFNTCWY
jgi:hypothetical protein